MTENREVPGYDVLLWIEEQVVVNGFDAPEIVIHSSNASVVQKMKLAVDSIKRCGG